MDTDEIPSEPPLLYSPLCTFHCPYSTCACTVIPCALLCSHYVHLWTIGAFFHSSPIQPSSVPCHTPQFMHLSPFYRGGKMGVRPHSHSRQPSVLLSKNLLRDREKPGLHKSVICFNPKAQLPSQGTHVSNSPHSLSLFVPLIPHNQNSNLQGHPPLL